MPDLLQFPPLARPTELPDGPENPQDRSDAEAREAALDIKRSWIVEAPAGSGKTGLLIQRYLKLLAFGHVQQPREVLVLTFTRKADGELRSRVLQQLTQAAASLPLSPSANRFDRITRELAEAVLQRDRLRHWHLIASPEQLNIRTIDSFCAELAASMPLLSNGTGHRPPVDDAFPLYRQAAERTLAQLGGPDLILTGALENLLAHRDAQVTDCTMLIANMLAQREQWNTLIPLEQTQLTDEFLDSEVRPRLERTLHNIVSAGLQRASDAIGSHSLEELARFATRLSSSPGYKGDPSPIAICSKLHRAPEAKAEAFEYWIALINLLLTKAGGWRASLGTNHIGFEMAKADKQWLSEIIEVLQHRESDYPHLRQALADISKLPDCKYPDDQWRVVKALCRVLARAQAELHLVFMQRRQSDFTEIAMTARKLLRPDASLADPMHPDVLQTSAAQLTHLLVDEMQDTSAGQYQLLEALTEYWDGASQTVFLVGDPKQSIYAFRQARVERFLRTMSTGRLGDLALGSLHLTENFRSQASLVEAFNETFLPIFPTSSAGSVGSTDHAMANVPFVAATPSRPATRSPALHWHVDQISKTEPSPASGTNAAETQSAQIRSLIEDFIANWPARSRVSGEPSRAPRIGVLARNRAHLAPIIAELRHDYGNGPRPFRAVDVESLNDRSEVLDLLALTRALLHPSDRVAWLAVLRSPMAGLALPDLLALTGEGPSAEPLATILDLVPSGSHLLSPEGQQTLARVWPILLDAHNTLGRTSLSLHVERVWRSLGGDAPLRAEERTNAYRFLDLLRKLESGPDPVSLPLLTHHLQRLYAEPAAVDTPVELMTIHKAKGLEWDLVLVPSLERGSGRSSQGLLKWLEIDDARDEANVLLAPIQGKGEDASRLYLWLGAGETQRTTAEAKRLFYVACTRAREELHLFATVETKSSGEICTPRRSDSLLNAAWPAARIVLQQQLDALRSSADRNVVPFSTPEMENEPEPLALAAAASEADSSRPERKPPPPLRRLPPSYDPLSRLLPEHGAHLPYTPASMLPRSAAFARPEGSFAARAFGNALHRFLNLAATRLADGQSLQQLRIEVPNWQSRIVAILRNEGLPTPLATTESKRALAALLGTLDDPQGAWLLAPHAEAKNEASLVPAGSAATALRADRIFLAGPQPLSAEPGTHLWVVDYKTAELGGRSRDSFLADQKAKYLPQMQAYAKAAIAAGTAPDALVLALYFPLLPALLSWKADQA